MGNKCSKSQRHLILDQINHSFCDLTSNVRNRNKFRLNDFDDNILSMIFSFMTLNDLLIIERVCKRWQLLISQIYIQSSRDISLSLGEHSLKCHCKCQYWINWTLQPSRSVQRDTCGYILYPNTLLKHLFTKLIYLKCLNLSHCFIDNQSLNMMSSIGQHLQCLHLYDIRLESDNNHNIGRQQWRCFTKRIGQQLTHLSIGGLQSLDTEDINILLSYCNGLDDISISNEIDIISYLQIIHKTVKRIYINCEHGCNIQCIQLLSIRQYAHKVIHLGRVDVEPDLIDSVISTIGSNFTNLRKLSLRLRNNDCDIRTPAEVLFIQLEELNLQFVSRNADIPFVKIISLGWTTIKCLIIQYASLTRDSVDAITAYLPQLNKLVLHAIEFRCDHQTKRYGHRLCVECGRHCWTCLATRLQQLTHLRLHRAIIDNEICDAIGIMSSLRHLDLHYCSNVNDNIVSICGELASRAPKQSFTLFIVSRAHTTLQTDSRAITNNKNFVLDIRDYRFDNR